MQDQFLTHDGRVPYAALELAATEAREQYPDALKVRAILANGAPLVEVYTEPARAFSWVPGWAR